MKTNFIFLAIGVLLTATCIFLLYMAKDINRVALYVTEGVIILCLILLAVFHHKVLKSFNTISSGMELLREQDFSSRLTKVGEPQADKIVDMFNRMMDQLKTERLHQREQNHFLNLIVKASPMGILTLGDNNRILSINPSARKFLSVQEELPDKSLYIDRLNGKLSNHISGMKVGEVNTVRIDSMIYRCSKLSYVDEGYSHPFILIETMTREILSAEKRAYEKVIRMLAHEVNNSITAVNSMLASISMFVKEETTSDEERAMMNEVIKMCEQRCMSLAKFITSIAAVVKIPEPQLEKLDLNKIINDARIILESMCFPHNIGLDIYTLEQPVLVNMDRVLFDQVIINILKNAVESIGENGNVTITVTSAPASVTIADNGKGIPEDVRDKLFSPFFSSKPNGQGLGLIFIREVLDKHNCQFSLSTDDDGLTRFRILFPDKRL